MPRLGAFVLSNYIAVIYVPVYRNENTMTTTPFQQDDIDLREDGFFELN